MLKLLNRLLFSWQNVLFFRYCLHCNTSGVFLFFLFFCFVFVLFCNRAASYYFYSIESISAKSYYIVHEDLLLHVKSWNNNYYTVSCCLLGA